MKKFLDSLNTAVFTTRPVYDGSESILFIFHHEEDGAWEFIGKNSLNESDYMVVALEEIINLDNSVLEVADLPLGFKASRDGKTSQWKTSPL